MDFMRELQKIQNAFLNNISHEIRTPLNAIVGCSDIMSMPDTDKETMAEMSQQVKRHSQYLLNMLDNILNISKLESGLFMERPNKFDLGFLFSYIYFSTKSLLMNDRVKRDNVTYQFISHLDVTPLYVWADDSIICQMVTAIVDNAIKFTDIGTVTLAVSYQVSDIPGSGPSDYNLVVDVEDTGWGIAPENQSLIFEKFRKVQPVDNRIYDGAGLGLAIVKNLAKVVDASIYLESEPGKGTKFRLKIPVVSCS